MKAIWNPFRASSVTLRTMLVPGACCEQLGRLVKVPMEGAPLAEKPFAGHVTERGFDVRWRSGHSGAISPVARGCFEVDPTGTVIVVRIRMGWSGWGLIVTWTGFAVVFGSLQVSRAILDTHTAAAVPSLLAVTLTPPVVMLAMLGLSLLWAGWLHRDGPDQILGAIKEALGAEEGADFRPLR